MKITSCNIAMHLMDERDDIRIVICLDLRGINYPGGTFL